MHQPEDAFASFEFVHSASSPETVRNACTASGTGQLGIREHLASWILIDTVTGIDSETL